MPAGLSKSSQAAEGQFASAIQAGLVGNGIECQCIRAGGVAIIALGILVQEIGANNVVEMFIERRSQADFL